MQVVAWPRFLFSFKDTATPEIYTLSLHDALPIYFPARGPSMPVERVELTDPRIRPLYDERGRRSTGLLDRRDRKSTRLNSSHSQISYAVFCLKKKSHHVYDHDVEPVQHQLGSVRF